MPARIEHCKRCLERYGESGSDLHEWMDEPVELWGPSHQRVRHEKNQEIPKFAIDRYGEELARNIMLDHLVADKKEKNKIKKMEKKMLDEAKQLGKITPIQKQLSYLEIEDRPQIEVHHEPENVAWDQVLAKYAELDSRLKKLEEAAHQ